MCNLILFEDSPCVNLKISSVSEDHAEVYRNCLIASARKILLLLNVLPNDNCMLVVFTNSISGFRVTYITIIELETI